MEQVGRSNQLYEREDYSPGEVISLERQGAECEPAAFPPMRVALIGNFAPRKCGIATFTTDVFEQLRHFHPQVGLDVYAMQDPADPLEHKGVYAEIDRDDRAAYDRAARRMNEDGADAVWLQHEFGIFGGECGEYVLRLVDRVAAPLIVTMHTVLSDPAPRQDAITRRLVERASRIMVMCRKGRDTLIERYRAEPDRIAIIEHGAPDRRLRPLRTDAPRTLMTFGLLGPGKGLETVIEALPAVIARHPRTIYRIAGISHPNEVRRQGEAYRDGLKALADRLGVAGHIEWVDRFLDTADLVALLEDCDIYVTPYPNLQQSTSGTLSYAVALGRAVVSTPYVHARELLGDIGGVLVPVNDAPAISQAVNRLLDNPAELEALQVRAYRRGRKTVWRHFADNSLALLQAAAGTDAVVRAPRDPVPPGLAGFDVLCDGTGILQHGKHIVPDRDHGYCLDDNARALMLVHRVSWHGPGEELRRAMPFASFVEHAWNEDARVFRNFMNYDRTWCEAAGSEDSNGRALWALGDAAHRSRLPSLRGWALDCFGRAASIALDFENPRSLAFAALGATAVLRETPDHALAISIAERCGGLLHMLLDKARGPDWAWFEALIGYDNPRLCEALIACGEARGKPEWVVAGLETLDWIMARQTSAKGCFRAVGSESFGRFHEILPFDQQPLEAWAAVDACAAALRIEPGESRWFEHARRAYAWFLGDNDRGVALADLQFGTCMDGINPHGANLNCGAESLLAFQLAYYAYEELAERAIPAWRENGAASRRT